MRTLTLEVTRNPRHWSIGVFEDHGNCGTLRMTPESAIDFIKMLDGFEWGYYKVSVKYLPSTKDTNPPEILPILEDNGVTFKETLEYLEKEQVKSWSHR